MPDTNASTPHSPVAPNSRRYAVVARHPTGGIRTHLKYLQVLAPPAANDPSPALVTPKSADGDLLAASMGLAPSHVVTAPSEALLALTRATYRAVRRFETRVVHSHGFTSAIAAFPVTLALRQRHIVTVHDVITDAVLRRTGTAQLAALGAILRSAYAVHAVGEDCAESLRILPFMRVSGNMVTIRNGIDVAQFSDVAKADVRKALGIDPSHHLFGFFGRFMAQKGFRTIVDAIAILAKDGTPRELCVLAVGSGGFIREDKAYIESKQLTQYFRFLDQVENPAGLIASVDCLLMPSRWEAYPILAAEALVLGVPLIATQCIGLREVVRDTPARTIPSSEPAALAAAIRDEIRAPTRTETAAFAATARTRFDFAPNAARIRTLIRSADQR